MPISVGSVLEGKYQITGVLGEGAMGKVYKGLHTRLKREVAIKTLLPAIADLEEAVGRFEQEARAASAIGHRNIVQIFDAGGDRESGFFIVMEFLDGQSLGERLEQKKRLPISETVALGIEVCKGLEAAHNQGIVHRDLKPDNIHISQSKDSEIVKLLDFGISKILDDSALRENAVLATQTGTAIGTPFYMSPEQAMGHPNIDHTTDLWALSCVLYECLVGHPPFAGDNYNQVMAAVVKGEFRTARSQFPEIPVALDNIISAGLSKNKSHRQSSAMQYGKQLQTLDVDSLDHQQKEMLQAFERLKSDNLQLSEAPPPEPAPRPNAVGTPIAVAAAPAPIRAAESAAFAPPQAELDSPLELSVQRPLEPKRSFKKREQNSSRRAKKKSNRLPFFLGFLFVIAGAIWATKHFDLLSYFRSKAPLSETASLDLIPPTTSVLVDDTEIAILPPIEGEVGTRKILKATAPGRLTAIWKHRFLPVENTPTVRLPFGRLILNGRSQAVRTSAFLDGNVPSLEAHMTRLDLLQNCAWKLPIIKQKDVSFAWLRSTQEKLSRIEKACANPMPDWQKKTIPLLETIAKLKELIKKIGAKGAKKTIPKKHRMALRSQLRTLIQHSRKFQVSVEQHRFEWLVWESEWAKQENYLLLHQAMVASLDLERWVRSRIAKKKNTDDLKKNFLKSHESLRKHMEENPEEAKATNIVNYFRSLEPLLNAKDQSWLRWFNDSVSVFNQIVFEPEIL